MEERGPPSTSIHDGDDYPLNPNHHYNHNLDTNNPQNLCPWTYVIQVPRDSIYRTPPPENALLVERHLNAPTKKPSNGPIKYVLIFLIILKIFLGIILWIIFVMVKKDDPRFHVERVHVTTKGKTRQQKHEFDITLASKNPNAHTIILFGDHGKTSLSFKDKKFAKGKFPSSKQDPKNSKDVKLALTRFSNTKLPQEIQTSMNETSKKTQKHVEILLVFRVPVKMKIGILQVKSKTLSMLCHFKVNNLAKNSRILSQDCDILQEYSLKLTILMVVQWW
ncbi:hypothetical protein L1987_52617 [Smallanthus sonchifolius]|uniref:Uncharacterized protein n=1 Tax=Smallanthus sonchifolius TaxID=185202 RepID=A0ACB9EU85_9ASTR|nr:hypothetical protein L1987_52617 [Smallanthus sonchifolius]